MVFRVGLWLCIDIGLVVWCFCLWRGLGRCLFFGGSMCRWLFSFISFFEVSWYLACFWCWYGSSGMWIFGFSVVW